MGDFFIEDEDGGGMMLSEVLVRAASKSASPSDDFAAWERVEAEIGTQARLMCSRFCSITILGACHCTAATNDEWRGRAIKALRDRRR